tara:strand:+ start:103 stop:285 length:183 start_codon:yes stop_codon:yes gene_type:complete
MGINKKLEFTNVDLENIYLGVNSVVFIDSLIKWLQERKKLGYSKIKPITEDKIINLITIR